MARLKCDLLLHYDEDLQRIIFYDVPLVATEAIRASAFCPLGEDVARFKALGATEAERLMGELVFSHLDRHGNKDLGLRDYAAVARDVHYQAIASLQQAALAGDADARFQIFQHLHMLALKEKSLTHLANAEQALTSAAGMGHVQAAALAPVWPRLKADALQVINAP